MLWACLHFPLLCLEVLTRSAEAALPMAVTDGEARPRIAAVLGGSEDGTALLQTLFSHVRVALAHGLQAIFVWSAVIMTAAIVLHVGLRGEPLRSARADVDVPMH